MELLYHLASSPNRVFTRNQLLDEVWGFDYFGDSRTVDVHVKRLREKLEGVSDKWSLKTVWGVGYKFEVVDIDNYRIDQLLVTRIDSKATALSPKLPDAKDKEESVA